jgi:UDP-N-acetylmuramate dehydrogenase
MGHPSDGSRSHRGRARPAASAFLDPEGVSAIQVLEQAGCGGLSVGGAEVPEEAPNTVVTHRHARSEDVAQLCRQVRRMVAERCDVELRPALCFLDETGRSIEP